jgi:hypothetical protein
VQHGASKIGSLGIPGEFPGNNSGTIIITETYNYGDIILYNYGDIILIYACMLMGCFRPWKLSGSI